MKSITDLQKEFSITVVEATDKKDELIDKLVKENNELRMLVEQLQQSVRESRGLIQIPAEEIICLEQIEILKSKSSQRELSTDEVKRLDLLVKNLKLIREKSDDTIDVPNLEKIGEDSLVAIARGES